MCACACVRPWIRAVQLPRIRGFNYDFSFTVVDIE